MLASLVGGFIVDVVGRRNTIVGNAVVFILGAVILATANHYGILILGRFIVGFGVSLSAIAEVIYISEIAPPTFRGLLVSLNEMGITIGVLIAYGVNYAFISTPGGWRYMFGLSAIPAAIQGVGMGFLPKSPRWLVLKEKPYDALKALRILRGGGGPAVEKALKDEIAQMEHSIQAQHNTKLSQLLTDPSLRRCLIIACGLALLQQFTGQSNVLYYGSTLFKAAGFTTDKQATLANMFIGIAKVVATAIALAKIDNLGRRGLLLWGVIIMTASLIALASVTLVYPPVSVATNSTSTSTSTTTATTALVMDLSSSTTTVARRRRDDVHSNVTTFVSDSCLQSLNYAVSSAVSLSGVALVDASASSWHSHRCRRDAGSSSGGSQIEFKNNAVKWTSMVCMVVFVIAYAFSFGPVTWLLLSELFPDDIRGRAMSLATVFNWGGNLVVSFTFLSLLSM